MNDEIFLQLRSDLCSFLHHKLGNDEAEDTIQEIYLRWHKLDLSGIKNPRAFLFTIAMNMIRDKARHQVHKLGHAVAVQNLHEHKCHIDEPAQHYDDRMQLQRLAQALKQLPEAVRHAFLLFRYDGMTHAEIARQLDLSKKTVSRHIQRASEHCLAALAEYRR